MKFKTLIRVLSVCATLSGLTASAQTGFDVYGPNRVFALSNSFAAITGTGNWTNQPILVRDMSGIAFLNLTVITNVTAATSTNTCTFTVQTSPDTTNWTTLTNAAIPVATILNKTNAYYGGTGIITSNTVFLPGTSTTPNAATAGFATPYLTAFQFTNGVSAYAPANETTIIAWSVDDAGPYVRVAFTGFGTNIVGGSLLGHIKGN